MFQNRSNVVSLPVWRCLALAFVLTGLSACTLITPYRPEVVQGNFVSLEQVQALRPGMPRQTVRDILGTPLVSSLFRADRWDYVFTIRRQGTEPQQRHLSVFFQGDVLARIEGDTMPSEAEFAARLDARRPPSKLPQLVASESELTRYPARAVAPQAAAQPATNTVYPPLEPASR